MRGPWAIYLTPWMRVNHSNQRVSSITHERSFSVHKRSSRHPITQQVLEQSRGLISNVAFSTRPVLAPSLHSRTCPYAETDEAASKKPLAESAARNGGKRKRMGASQQGAVHSANGVPGTSGETLA